jgi:putative DNA primase/helicase
MKTHNPQNERIKRAYFTYLAEAKGFSDATLDGAAKALNHVELAARAATTSETIAKALGGRKAGGSWMARCPVHDDREPSLSVRDADDGKVLIRCHAGCDQAQVIAELRRRRLWAERGPPRSRSVRPQQHQALNDKADDTKRTGVALSIWQATVPAADTPVEIYLRSRGIGIALPPTIRFHAGLRHPRGGLWPAMVVLVTRGRDNAPLAIHRTFLSRDGTGKASVEPQRMMLGPCRSGAVQLAPVGDRLMVGEGIETCLAAMQATGMPAWAALSTSGLRVLDLPGEARDVIVLADGDDPGEAAALEAALRWSHEGRRVRIARPPQGLDFNDMLLGRISAPTEGDRHVAP